MNTVDIDTRHGPMRVLTEDIWVSRCLRELGEHSQSEVQFLKFALGLLSHGAFDGVVIDAGAYIGDLTIPLSRMARKVYAFEPQVEIRDILHHNLQINNCTNVEIIPYALGAVAEDLTYSASANVTSPGSTMLGVEGDSMTSSITLDSLYLPEIDLLKADVEGMEIPLLGGALETLGRTRCSLFLEDETVVVEGQKLTEVLTLLGYDSYPMYFPMWSPQNYRQNPVNNFGATVAKMVLAVPGGPVV